MSRGRRRRRRFNGCRDKAAFGTYEDAVSIQSGGTPYFCPSCGCWHITSNPVSKL